MKHPEIVEKMTLEEKARFVSGGDYWHTEGDDALGLPAIMLTDGPHGLRKKDPNPPKGSQKINLGNSVPATCMPPASANACSWDPELLYRMGQALADECIRERVSVILGPGANIKRSPLCGRNFEYFSEDPYLAGKCAAALIRGIQSKGIGASLKHFACNSQETFRMIVNEAVDERALREIYLAQYEIAVKEAQPWTVMNAYNRLNGVYCSQHERLQNQILREEWGFDGLIVTDWGASVDRTDGILAGTDLEMPSSGAYNTKKIVDAVTSGALPQAALDTCVDRVVDLILKAKQTLEHAADTCDYDRNHAVAQSVAEGSMVLLKNEGGILPLAAGARIAVIGEMAQKPRFQGPGSSVVNPTRLDNAWDGLVGLGFDCTYAAGYHGSNTQPDGALQEEAVAAAQAADVAIVFAGLPDGIEAEGYERTAMDLPDSHQELIRAVAQANPNTVVVLACGCAVTMPWLPEVQGVLHSLLGGQAGGSAVARLLAGQVNPSGKLAETYPIALADTPAFGNYPCKVASEHKESIYIGYRYYDTAHKQVQFPFGFGLSYTTFAYSGLRLSAEKIQDTESVSVSFRVKNTGAVAGAEVVQLYVHDVESTIFRPEKELKGFQKVFLEPGEEQEVTLTLSKRAFAFYNVTAADWQVETGSFEILVGSSSRDIRLSAALTVTDTTGAAIPDYRATAPSYYTAAVQGISDAEWSAVYGPLPERTVDPAARLTIYHCLDDARHTKWGGRICRLISGIMKNFGSSENGDGKMLQEMALQIPIRNFIAMSMGVFSEKMADGLLEILNDDGHTGRGICRILAGVPHAITHIKPLLDLI